MTVLTKQEIADLGLVVDPAPDALQPCGVDLTVASIDWFGSEGAVTQDGVHLPLVQTYLVQTYTDNWMSLPRGAYRINYAQELHLPDDITAFVYPRSSLLRCGATIYTAVWDPGYRGKGQGLLVVHNPFGLTLERFSRVAQVVFHRLSSSADAYAGQYQGEGVEAGRLSELFDLAGGYKETEE